MASIAMDQPVEAGARNIRFTLTIFAGSFLLFLVQPMLARMALPRLGGSPAVWNSAMLVYQALLLAGYAYAHWLGRFAGRTQAAIHLALILLAALTLPIGLSAAQPSSEANSFLWVPWLLLLSVGPLFFVISAQAPLLQRWFAMSRGADPYPLYVASNLGSFSGLLAYPLLLEPMLGVGSQSRLWTAGYALLVLLVAWCALRLIPFTDAPSAATRTAAPVARGAILRWILLAAIPSGLMLSTTLHLTTDVAPMPLLWVIPLGLYLLSFSVGFSQRRALAELCERAAPFTLLVTAATLLVPSRLPMTAMLLLVLLNLFMVAVALHSALFKRRPDPQQLTLFYLALSIGGVLGGLFCALVAPLLFNWTYENPILLIAAAVAVGGKAPIPRLGRIISHPAGPRRLLAAIALLAAGALYFGQGQIIGTAATLCVGLLLAAGVFAAGNRALFAAVVAALLLVAGGSLKIAQSLTPDRLTRSYFGVTGIDPNVGAKVLVHGTTIHGAQLEGSINRQRTPLTYYSPTSGAGRAMGVVPALYGPGASVSVVGLGTGTLSCYARPDQQWTYFEIDPAIVGIARDSGQFTFLRNCKPDTRIVLGDARLRIADQPAASADVLVIDAFSSDAVPMHLLTREAFEAYGRYLKPGGLLLVHISNRHLDLKPVVAAAAREMRWTAVLGMDTPRLAHSSLVFPSIWVAMAPEQATIRHLAAADRSGFWEPLRPTRNFDAWTDDFGSILPIIKTEE